MATDPMSILWLNDQEFEIVDKQARAGVSSVSGSVSSMNQAMESMSQSMENMSQSMGNMDQAIETAQKPLNLYDMEDGRATTANIEPTGSDSLQYILATSSMTEGKPPIGDSKILQMEWDNTGGWTTQAAFGHSGNRTAANAMALRSMKSGTWGDWQTLLDLLYPVGSVYINNTNTNPSGTLGGTWSLIHQRFAYQIVEDVVTFNTTNTQNTNSVAVINDDTIQLRLSFAPKVDLADTTVEIGQLNLSQIGLTGKYAEYVPFFADAGNGIAFLQITNTGLVQTQEVVPKGTATSIPAGTSAGQARCTLMFGQGSMIDRFCNEFHWLRTA